MPDTVTTGTTEVPAPLEPPDPPADAVEVEAEVADAVETDEQDDATPVDATPVDAMPVDAMPDDAYAPELAEPEAPDALGTVVDLTGQSPPKDDSGGTGDVSLPWLGAPRPLPGAGAHAVPPVGWGFRSALAVGEFPRTGWGHRGYDEQAVDDFVERVGHELVAADDQIGDLRSEVDRLHRYIRRQWAAVAAAEAGRRDERTPASTPSAQARSMLTQAQELAERRIEEASARLAETDRIAQARLADAEREAGERLQEADELATRRIREAELSAARQMDRVESRAEQLLAESEREAARRRFAAEEDHERVLDLARTGYEDIVRRAHRRADQAAELALAEFGTPEPEKATVEAMLEARAAYLRTFAKATRTALEMALEVSAAEFDRLLGVSAAHETGGRRARVIALPTRTGDTPMSRTS